MASKRTASGSKGYVRTAFNCITAISPHKPKLIADTLQKYLSSPAYLLISKLLFKHLNNSFSSVSRQAMAFTSS